MAMTLEHDTERASAPSIDLRGLRKSFRTSGVTVEAVRGVDVSVASGETVALLGPNGAGKSTTIDILLGLQRADSGSVALFGGTPEQAVARGRVGVMLQSGGLLRDLTARELVTMMAALYPAPLAVDEALELAGAVEIADRRTEKLSGGERAAHPLRRRARQRSRVARARRADGRHGRRGPARASGRPRATCAAQGRRSCSRPTTSRRPTPTPTAPC